MDNNPNIILNLVARNERTCEVWADSHNESFYLPAKLGGTKLNPRKVDKNQDATHRAVTPIFEGEDSEPTLQITFSKRPKNPELGYLLGSDRELCDIFLGTSDQYVSRKMFAISFNQYNEVTMKTSSSNLTVVDYSKQSGERWNFTVRHFSRISSRSRLLLES